MKSWFFSLWLENGVQEMSFHLWHPIYYMWGSGDNTFIIFHPKSCFIKRDCREQSDTQFYSKTHSLPVTVWFMHVLLSSRFLVSKNVWLHKGVLMRKQQITDKPLHIKILCVKKSKWTEDKVLQEGKWKSGNTCLRKYICNISQFTLILYKKKNNKTVLLWQLCQCTFELD